MKTGVYYNKSTEEVISISAGDEEPGDGWVHVSDEPEFRLVPVRALLVKRGFVRNAQGVYWHMPQPEEDTGSFFDGLPSCAA